MGRGADGLVALGNYGAELNLKASGKLCEAGLLVSILASSSSMLTFSDFEAIKRRSLLFLRGVLHVSQGLQVILSFLLTDQKTVCFSSWDAMYNLGLPCMS